MEYLSYSKILELMIYPAKIFEIIIGDVQKPRKPKTQSWSHIQGSLPLYQHPKQIKPQSP